MISRRLFLTLLGIAPAMPAMAMLPAQSDARQIGVIGHTGPEVVRLPAMPSLLMITTGTEEEVIVYQTRSGSKLPPPEGSYIWRGPAFDNADDLIAYLDTSA